MAILLALPLALLTGFGRMTWSFQMFGQFVSLLPGLPGDYIRAAYYVLTLRSCSLEVRISFGSFFSQRCVTIGKGVYVGAYCVFGACDIGERTQIASHVQVLSGRRQHGRDSDGRIMGAQQEAFSRVTIDSDCWIGAGAIVMADVGSHATVGAGAVVTRVVTAYTVVVGNPARPLSKDGVPYELQAELRTSGS